MLKLDHIFVMQNLNFEVDDGRESRKEAWSKMTSSFIMLFWGQISDFLFPKFFLISRFDWDNMDDGDNH